MDESMLASSAVSQYSISEAEFNKFKRLIYVLAGISLSEAKRSLVLTRLSKRLRFHNLNSFSDYYKLVSSAENIAEQQMMVDLLTTNETYFFREPRHFELLKDIAGNKQDWAQPLRVWSAAASSGEEAYSISMVLEDIVGDKPWEVVGTDISTRVLESARRGVYVRQRTANIPNEYLKRFCKKGVRSQEGMVLVQKVLRDRVQFKHMNLLGEWSQIGQFDFIFLRNVMIYFDMETKQRLIERLVTRLKKGGYLFIGHSESLNGLRHDLKIMMPSVFVKKT